MNIFFVLIEFLMYGFAVFIIIRKKELALLYLPVIFFANTVIAEHVVSAMVYYGVVTAVFIYAIRYHSSFVKANIFAVLIILYFLVLMGKSGSLVKIRQDLFNVMWLFFAIPLLPTILKRFSRDVVLKELAVASSIILGVFIVNVVLCTIFRYDVYSMYGITSGVLYGHMYATDFNILAIAVFILVLRTLQTRNMFYLVLTVVALIFISLSLRRSVIGLSAVGVGLIMFLFFLKNTKNAVLFGLLTVGFCWIVALKTNFITSFSERYELRNLEERSIAEEKRLFEYEILYRDMFLRERYSAWFGFELFNSAGNYGDGKFYDRTLHSDLTSILHSSGIVGLVLYLMMVFAAFFRAVRAGCSRVDNMLLLFCGICFIVYTLTGRFTQVGSMFLLFSLLNLTVASPETVEELDEEEAEAHSGALAPG